MPETHRVTHNIDARVPTQCEWCGFDMASKDWMAYIDGIPACSRCAEKARAGEWLAD